MDYNLDMNVGFELVCFFCSNLNFVFRNQKFFYNILTVLGSISSVD